VLYTIIIFSNDILISSFTFSNIIVLRNFNNVIHFRQLISFRDDMATLL
jgi:hypothetical protein